MPLKNRQSLRPKGCMRTISGRHMPTTRTESYTIISYCQACGLRDDIGLFQAFLFPNTKKIDDKDLK